jgi:hypothetical protein
MLSQMVLDPSADREVAVDRQVAAANVQVGGVPICVGPPSRGAPAKRSGEHLSMQVSNPVDRPTCGNR